MKLKIYQIDAFAEKLFGGNPAAVVPLADWLPDSTMQSIAFENNLAETAFFVKTPDGFHIRWFTPNNEVNLCGHATLASAHVLFHIEKFPENEIQFNSLSGILKVRKGNGSLVLDFPAYTLIPDEATNDLLSAIGTLPAETFKVNEDILFVYHDEHILQMIRPDFRKMKECKARAVLVTAPSANADFVYRFFAPKMGLDEDPATGSAQCSLVPYWSNRLQKSKLTSIQLSSRTGHLKGELCGNRVEISGNTLLYMTGEIEI